MAEVTQTPAIERAEDKLQHSRPDSPASPPAKRTKYIEPVDALAVTSVLDKERPTTPTPTEQPTTMPSATQTLPTSPQKPAGHPHSESKSKSQSQPQPPLQVKLLSATATPPTRGSASAAGYDIYASSPSPITIPARGKALIETGLAIAVPEGTYGRVAPRSGLAVKHSIDVGAGVIDADYRGEVRVLLFNLGPDDFVVNKGDRIAQLVLERICTPEVVVVDALDESVRGEGGFGSTGGFGAGVEMPALPTVS